jgi:hypothetical protein
MRRINFPWRSPNRRKLCLRQRAAAVVDKMADFLADGVRANEAYERKIAEKAARLERMRAMHADDSEDESEDLKGKSKGKSSEMTYGSSNGTAVAAGMSSDDRDAITDVSPSVRMSRGRARASEKQPRSPDKYAGKGKGSVSKGDGDVAEGLPRRDASKGKRRLEPIDEESLVDRINHWVHRRSDDAPEVVPSELSNKAVAYQQSPQPLSLGVGIGRFNSRVEKRRMAEMVVCSNAQMVVQRHATKFTELFSNDTKIPSESAAVDPTTPTQHDVKRGPASLTLSPPLPPRENPRRRLSLLHCSAKKLTRKRITLHTCVDQVSVDGTKFDLITSTKQGQQTANRKVKIPKRNTSVKFTLSMAISNQSKYGRKEGKANFFTVPVHLRIMIYKLVVISPHYILVCDCR